jgi:hypothetical protein
MPFQAKRGIAGRHQNCSGYLSTVPDVHGIGVRELTQFITDSEE